MTCKQKTHPGVAALRPWPYGPPLRGRAKRSDAGVSPAPSWHALPTANPDRRRPLVGGLPHIATLYCMS
jgi:hypothetical protein